MTTPALAQEMGDMPAMEADMLDGGMPMTEMGGGDFFSQDLGTLLRMRYNTESYGQDQRGNLDIGTMQVASFEDAIAFFDGQITLNDVTGVGYNLGVGFRWLHWAPFPLEPERITGFSFWTDGTSTESGNFFPQIGLSYESLGDMWDLRINGYIPLGQEVQIGTFSETGDIVFSENFLVLEEIADRNASFNVAEAEIARRLMGDRDAWAFAGPYVLANSEQDAAGYRVGVRGYAYPDLLVQIAVTDDDIFKTNAAFSVTWFVGRTRTSFQPACGLPDRMREPVMRNDYVALEKTIETGGEALTNTDGEAFRFVHVDSDAADGGDGTFENPLNNVGNVEGASQEDDIILLYSGSNFNSQNTLVLQDNQQLLGEGDDQTFTITTEQAGIVDIPETSPGARAGMRANIVGTSSSDGAVQLADANEVANFNIDGAGSAAGAGGIFSPTTGAGNPNIHDMNFSNVSGTGIQFTPLTRVDEDNALLMTVAGNVTIDDVNFTDMLGVEIDIDSFTTTDVTDPNVTLQETIAISDIDSQNGSSQGLWLRNTHDNRTATITNYVNGTVGTADSGGGDAAMGVLRFEELLGNVTLTNIDIFANTGYALDFLDIDATSAITITSGNGFTWNGLAGAAGGMRFDNFDGTITANSSTLEGGTLAGVQIIGASDGTFTFPSTTTFSSIDGTTIDIDGNSGIGANEFTGVATFSGTIANDAGRSVSIRGISGAGTSVTIAGDITETGASEGILVDDNSGGTILFSGDIDQTLTAQDGITLISNTGTDISFAGLLDITTDGSGQAFSATGGGTLTVGGNANTLTTNGNTALEIVGMTISSAGANFAEVNSVSGVNGIVLRDNITGPITIGILGDDPGDSGTISGTTGAAVVIDNSANVTISALQIDTTAGQTGVEVTKDTTGTQITNLNDLEINGGANGIDVIGTGTGTLNMTVNDSTINNVTARGLRINNIDAGTIAVNGTTIDGDNVTGTAQGVQIIDSNATITFDADTLIQQFMGTAFEVDGGTGSVTFSGDITNTAGQSVHVHNRTSGSVQFTSTSTITDTGLGILVEDNTGGTVSFLGTNDLDPVLAATEAVFLDNNTGATVNFASLNINTANDSDTRGFVAQGGGTVSVTGTTNVIDTEEGAGLVLDGMTIGSVDFQSVTVDGTSPPVNAILLQSLTGGQVEIGTSTGADGSGGTLNSSGDAIVITNAANVALHDIIVNNASAGDAVAITKSNIASTTITMDNVDVTNAGADGVNVAVSASGQVNLTIDDSDFTTLTGEAIDVTANGTANDVNVTIDQLTASDNIVATTANSAALDFRLTNSTITGTTTMNIDSSGNFDMLVENSTLTASAVGAIALDLNFGTNAQDGDVIVRNNTISAGNANGLEVTASGTNADIDFLLDNNDITNNSAASETAEIVISGGATFDANVVNNTFTNSGAADEYAMTSDGSSTRINLNLDNNTTAGVYELTTANNGGGFNFGVQDRDNTNANNVGTVNFNPLITDFEDITGPVQEPVLP